MGSAKLGPLASNAVGLWHRSENYPHLGIKNLVHAQHEKLICILQWCGCVVLSIKMAWNVTTNKNT